MVPEKTVFVDENKHVSEGWNNGIWDARKHAAWQVWAILPIARHSSREEDLFRQFDEEYAIEHGCQP